MSKNYEIECAIAEIEKELVELKKKKSPKYVNAMNIGVDEVPTDDGTLPEQKETHVDENMPEDKFTDKSEPIKMDTSVTKANNAADNASVDEENKENQ